MKIIICIDDTDMPGTPGTGHLADSITEKIESNRWGKCSAITRHQLFVHEDVPYTSHNSSMCFIVHLTDSKHYEPTIKLCQECLEKESVPGSDPGLCVIDTEQLQDKNRLIEYGMKTKTAVIRKSQAYELAEILGVHLTEHGGDGQGIVGALAGAGLRLGGNDGRFRGWYHLQREGEEISVKELCSHSFIESVRSEDNTVLEPEEIVILGGDKIKTVLQDQEQSVIVSRFNSKNNGNYWKSLTKEEVKRY